ncbi:MAG: F0F1 ATP synthase subunit delta [Nautiliaceae bacterium]|jgi:F-type H+-transporting ATPase subunit delta
MIVEKYTKALLAALSEDEVVEVYEAVARLALVAKNPKFILIVKSPLLTLEEKVKILQEIGESNNPKFINFIKILLENKRVDLLKEIHQSLYEKVSKLFNTYAGLVEGKVSEETLKAIEEKLSKEFNATIKLQLKDVDLNGIKVFVDVLNVEVSILEDRIKQDLLTQILKAI